MPARRLFGLIWRLSAYDGAVAARLHQMEQEEKNRNPSRAVMNQPGTVYSNEISSLGSDLVEHETV